jgi:hypothetical protein
MPGWRLSPLARLVNNMPPSSRPDLSLSSSLSFILVASYVTCWPSPSLPCIPAGGMPMQGNPMPQMIVPPQHCHLRTMCVLGIDPCWSLLSLPSFGNEHLIHPANDYDGTTTTFHLASNPPATTATATTNWTSMRPPPLTAIIGQEEWHWYLFDDLIIRRRHATDVVHNNKATVVGSADCWVSILDPIGNGTLVASVIIVIVPPPPRSAPPCIPLLPATFFYCWMPHSTMYQSVCPLPSPLPLHQSTPMLSVFCALQKVTKNLCQHRALITCVLEGFQQNQAHTPLSMVWGWRLCTWLGHPHARDHGREQSCSSPRWHWSSSIIMLRKGFWTWYDST